MIFISFNNLPFYLVQMPKNPATFNGGVHVFAKHISGVLTFWNIYHNIRNNY